jgi:hypothetical protein
MARTGQIRGRKEAQMTMRKVGRHRHLSLVSLRVKMVRGEEMGHRLGKRNCPGRAALEKMTEM